MNTMALGWESKDAICTLSNDFSVVSDCSTVRTLPLTMNTRAVRWYRGMKISSRKMTANRVAKTMPVAVLLVRRVMSANGRTTKAP